jgi:hypothetical protein
MSNTKLPDTSAKFSAPTGSHVPAAWTETELETPKTNVSMVKRMNRRVMRFMATSLRLVWIRFWNLATENAIRYAAEISTRKTQYRQFHNSAKTARALKNHPAGESLQRE